MSYRSTGTRLRGRPLSEERFFGEAAAHASRTGVRVVNCWPDRSVEIAAELCGDCTRLGVVGEGAVVDAGVVIQHSSSELFFAEALVVLHVQHEGVPHLVDDHRRRLVAGREGAGDDVLHEADEDFFGFIVADHLVEREAFDDGGISIGEELLDLFDADGADGLQQGVW